jgi:xylonate dehydratase
MNPALFDSDVADLFNIRTRVPGPRGSLPLPGDEFLLLSTHGGIRAPDGSPIALGYHTGHWEVGLLVEGAAHVLRDAGAIPFAASCTDPCDGRSQGTSAMFDSLPFRNDAATVFRRLIRSLPTRRGVLGVATCDKGLPAMMMALAATRDLPCVLVPGGVTLLSEAGEDAGAAQTIGVRFVHGEITLEEAAEIGCRACGTPGGGCQFLGTAATSQVIGEALGLALGHSALAPSGHPIWMDAAHRSARALLALTRRGLTTRDIVTDAALENALVVHAAFGGSTNMILHIPAIAHAAGLRRPTVDDWRRVNREVPRLVDALPNGPRNHPTVQVFMAGAVPEVMLHLRRAGLLQTRALTAAGVTLGEQLDAWECSERRVRLRETLSDNEKVDADDVIMSPDTSRRRGLASTVCFPGGNLAPGGSVVKSTAIDPSLVDQNGVYRHVGRAKVFTSEPSAMAAIKEKRIHAGDVIVLICRGAMGAGMEETYQITAAVRHLPFGKQVAVITDARFSGVSTGACIGHVSPEALAGGPIGKLRDGDLIEILVNQQTHDGSINFLGDDAAHLSREEGTRTLAARAPRPDLAADEKLPDDTRIWAVLQDASGGTWGGAVFDAESILRVVAAGKEALRNES